MLNDLDRFHLVMDAIDRVPTLGGHAVVDRQAMVDMRSEARRCTRETGTDLPSVADWEWSAGP
jgi:xylulose-5-phosphate/fructose-6-phosphate phosphoketolase